MQVNLIGKLSGSCDLADTSKSLKQVKEFSLYVLNDEESYQKLQNLLSSHSTKKMPIYTIARSKGLNGYEVIIRVRTTTGKLGTRMLETPRTEWGGKQFSIRFTIVGYNFKSRLEHNQGELVKGCNFMLEHIDIC